MGVFLRCASAVAAEILWMRSGFFAMLGFTLPRALQCCFPLRVVAGFMGSRDCVYAVGVIGWRVALFVDRFFFYLLALVCFDPARYLLSFIGWRWVAWGRRDSMSRLLFASWRWGCLGPARVLIYILYICAELSRLCAYIFVRSLSLSLSLSICHII